MGIEQVREGPDCVRETRQPILESPPRNIAKTPKAEGEIGRAAGLERGLDLGRLVRQEQKVTSTCLPVSCSKAATTSASASSSPA
jgi:hypothetical protein